MRIPPNLVAKRAAGTVLLVLLTNRARLAAVWTKTRLLCKGPSAVRQMFVEPLPHGSTWLWQIEIGDQSGYGLWASVKEHMADCQTKHIAKPDTAFAETENSVENCDLD